MVSAASSGISQPNSSSNAMTSSTVSRTVSTEIVDEAGVLGHLFGLDAQMLHDDLFHPLANVTHRCNLVSV
jgi:hypothetical protein